MRTFSVFSTATILCLALILLRWLPDSHHLSRWQLVTEDSNVSDSEPIFSLAFSDAKHGWMLTVSQLLTTNDGGQSWTVKLESDIPQKAFYSLSFLSPTTGIIIGSQLKAEGYTALALRTEDGGESWREIVMNVETQPEIRRAPMLRTISFCDSTVGWTVGNDLILRTADSGQTWETQRSNNHGEVLLGVQCVSPERAWAVGQDGLILHTEDGGKSWRRQDSGTKDNLVRIYFYGGSGWILGGMAGRGTLLQTRDGGATWKPQQLEISETLFDIYINGGQGWMVGSGGGTLHTKDGGQTWQREKSPTDNDLTCLFFLNPQHGWAGGDKRTIVKLSE